MLLPFALLASLRENKIWTGSSTDAYRPQAGADDPQGNCMWPLI